MLVKVNNKQDVEEDILRTSFEKLDDVCLDCCDNITGKNKVSYKKCGITYLKKISAKELQKKRKIKNNDATN